MSTTSLFKSKFSPKKASARKTITISPLQMDAVIKLIKIHNILV